MDGCGHLQGSPRGSHQAPSVLQGTGGTSGSKGVQSQVRGQCMVPCLLWWEFVKGFLREDISEVMVLGWHHVLEGSAYLSLLRFLGQLLQWGICSPDVVFHPLRGDEHGVNHISGFWSIVRMCLRPGTCYVLLLM